MKNFKVNGERLDTFSIMVKDWTRMMLLLNTVLVIFLLTFFFRVI